MVKDKFVTPDNPISEWSEKRIGFVPDVLVRVVGVTMGPKAKHRQKALELAKRFQDAETAPPVKLVRERNNPVDPGAILVYIGTDVNVVDGVKKWVYTEIGYIPKEYRIKVRDRSGKLVENHPKAPDGFLLYRIMDALEEKRGEGVLKVGVNFVTKAPGTETWGCEIGLRMETPAS